MRSLGEVWAGRKRVADFSDGNQVRLSSNQAHFFPKFSHRRLSERLTRLNFSTRPHHATHAETSQFLPQENLATSISLDHGVDHYDVVHPFRLTTD